MLFYLRSVQCKKMQTRKTVAIKNASGSHVNIAAAIDQIAPPCGAHAASKQVRL